MNRTRGNTPYAADRAGFALVIVTLVMVVAAAVIGGSVTLGSNHLLVNRYHQRNDQLVAAADAGLEMVRARLNGEPGLYPGSGYVTLESNAQVSNGAGGWVPGVRRSLYAGPMGYRDRPVRCPRRGGGRRDGTPAAPRSCGVS